MSSNDLVLARRLLAGSEEAFDEFFDRYFPRLFRFALARLGGNEDTAEEIVQRVLIRAIGHLGSYRGEAALLTWLCTLCRHEIGAWHEREGRAPVSFDEDGPALRAALETITDVDDPEQALRRHELSRLVQVTLDHLPGRYGEILEWRYIHELSVGDIAGRLGVGYKAAESLLTRARNAFRQAFAFPGAEWHQRRERDLHVSEGT